MPNTPNVVLDAVGNVPSVGDRVVFAPAQRGAQEFVKGIIVKVNDKTITIGHGGWKYNSDSRDYIWVDDVLWNSTRKSGCFVIVKESN
jgi:hypothetical protein